VILFCCRSSLFVTVTCSVWLDINNEEEAVPDFDGDIVMKVSRVSWQGDEREGVSTP
jgi:hypothetical protein